MLKRWFIHRFFIVRFMRFSQRNGYKSIGEIMQKEFINNNEYSSCINQINSPINPLIPT